jgi:ABC-type uncharacterized transport system substrate-binding protein
MNTCLRTLKRSVLALVVATTLSAGDYDALLSTVAKAKPEWKTAAAMCSLDMNQLALLDLTDSAKQKGISLIVMNVASAKDVEPMLRNLVQRKPDFLILMEEDLILGVKSKAGAMIVGRANNAKIPTLAITKYGLKLGALFAIGADTNGKLLGNSKVAKALGVALPEGAESSSILP